jgi:hypothetical protein
MFDGNMFFRSKDVAMGALINGHTFVLVERNKDIHDMLNDFGMSIKLLFEVDIRVSGDSVEFIGSILLQESKYSGCDPTDLINLFYLLIVRRHVRADRVLHSIEWFFT